MPITTSLHRLFFARYLGNDDEIVRVFHRHFLAVFPNILFWILIPTIGVSWLVYKWFYPGILETPFLWLFEGYLLIVYILILYRIIDWYADAWILTRRGVIDVRWSLFMLDMSFTEYHDISAVEYSQRTLFDKVFHMGDVVIHKMGDEFHISRMYRADAIVDAIQDCLYQEHSKHEEHSTTPNMHIYVDGFRQNTHVTAYKNGFRYTPGSAVDDAYLRKIKEQPGTIDLSGN